jgi:hypothetical protein
MLRQVCSKAILRTAARTAYSPSSSYLFGAKSFSQSHKNGDSDDEIQIPSEKERSFGRDRQDVEAKEEGDMMIKVSMNKGIVICILLNVCHVVI